MIKIIKIEKWKYDLINFRRKSDKFQIMENNPFKFLFLKISKWSNITKKGYIIDLAQSITNIETERERQSRRYKISIEYLKEKGYNMEGE